MNNRGKALSTLEILKNRLIYLSSNVPEFELGDAKLLRKQINDAWAIVYHNIGRNEKRPLNDDDFLRAHLANYYHERVSKDLPTDEDQQAKFLGLSYSVLEDPADFLLRNHFTRNRLLAGAAGGAPLTAKSLQEYTTDLRSSAETYFKISTPATSGYSDDEKVFLERLGRLRGYDAGPLVLALFKRESNPKQRTAFLDTYERYLFCASLKNGYRSGYARGGLMVEVIKFIKGSMKTHELVTYYNNLVEQLFKEDTLADTLHDWTKNGPGYYGWRSIRYFLFEYELSRQ